MVRKGSGVRVPKRAWRICRDFVSERGEAGKHRGTLMEHGAGNVFHAGSRHAGLEARRVGRAGVAQERSEARTRLRARAMCSSALIRCEGSKSSHRRA